MPRLPCLERGIADGLRQLSEAAPMTPTAWLTGKVRAKDDRVVWTMDPDEARELADFLEEQTGPDDEVRNDVAALRKAADKVAPESVR